MWLTGYTRRFVSGHEGAVPRVLGEVPEFQVLGSNSETPEFGFSRSSLHKRTDFCIFKESRLQRARNLPLPERTTPVYRARNQVLH